MASIYDWSTTASNNANSDDGINWPEGQAPSTVNNSARAMMGRLAELVGDIGGSLEPGGTANALTLTANSAFTAYADGIVLAFKATANNTGATTLSVNTLGAKAIRRIEEDGSDAALEGGEIRTGGIYTVRFSEDADSSAGGWLLDWQPKVDPIQYVPVGSGMDFWGSTAPTGYVFAYGQAISRTTYSDLFAVMGTTYGVGDGSTTFNVPDRRGRTSFGKDDMGGVSADRLTDQGSGGIDGDVLGDTGGSETHTLTTAELAAHTHGDGTLAVASHSHGSGSLTLPNHSHSVQYFDTDVDGVGDVTAATGSSGNRLLGTNAISGWSDSIQTFGENTTIPNSGTASITGSTATASPGLTGATGSTGSGDAHNTLPPGIVCNYIIFTGVE